MRKGCYLNHNEFREMSGCSRHLVPIRAGGTGAISLRGGEEGGCEGNASCPRGAAGPARGRLRGSGPAAGDPGRLRSAGAVAEGRCWVRGRGICERAGRGSGAIAGSRSSCGGPGQLRRLCPAAEEPRGAAPRGREPLGRACRSRVPQGGGLRCPVLPLVLFGGALLFLKAARVCCPSQ